MTEQEKIALVLHLASRHGGSRDFNERNPGLGVRVPIGRRGLYGSGGFYRNSLDRTSAYAGVGKEVLTLGDLLGLNLNAGVVSGYDERLLPFLLPELRLRLGRSGVNALFQYIPKMRHNDLETESTLGMSLQFPFRMR